MIERNKMLWRLKVPLKIKIFMWYMKKVAVLTKDNLARRNWTDNKQCNFYLRDESIHLFYDCYYARFLWGLPRITFNIPPPPNVQHKFSTWINMFGGKLKRQIPAGASVFCWAIWLSRNDMVFDKSPTKIFM
jgi:hypothetical protein